MIIMQLMNDKSKYGKVYWIWLYWQSSQGTILQEDLSDKVFQDQNPQH